MLFKYYPLEMIANYFSNKSSETANEDWQLPLAFLKKHHLEPIEGAPTILHSWRMKERVCWHAFFLPDNFTSIANSLQTISG